MTAFEEGARGLKLSGPCLHPLALGRADSGATGGGGRVPSSSGGRAFMPGARKPTQCQLNSHLCWLASGSSGTASHVGC